MCVAGVPFGPLCILSVIEVKVTFGEVGLWFGDVALTSFAQRDICFTGAAIVSRPLWLQPALVLKQQMGDVWGNVCVLHQTHALALVQPACTCALVTGKH